MPEDEEVNHPSHYTVGNIETIEVIKDTLTENEYIGYCRGNLIKYILRYKHKGGVVDLKKGFVYLKWLIEAEEQKEFEGR